MPEEEVWRDGGAEHRHQRHDEILREFDVGDDGRPENLQQRGVGKEGGNDIGEQCERQPLENLEDRGIGGEDLERDDEERHRYDQPQRVNSPTRQQRTGRGHRPQVGADVERVGGEQSENGDADQPAREFATQARSQPDAGLKRDPRAQLLHRAHQRKGEERQPEQPVPKLAPDLGVGADAAGIVVAGAGDQPRAEPLQEADEALARRRLDG